MTPRVYLAGPEVFLASAAEIGAAKREICRRFGLEGVTPFDDHGARTDAFGREAGLAIYRENLKRLEACDGLIANMTPFRGPSADVGTAFEMGFMRGRGRPVFAYTNVAERFEQRVRRRVGIRGPADDEAGRVEDPDGMAIETFDMIDNAMLDGAVGDGGAEIVARSVAAGRLYTDLRAFTECVRRAAAALGV